MATILVVDDDEKNLRLAVTVLGQLEHDVLSARSGPEAIAITHLRTVDLILMDVQMPGMDGISALRLLREDARTATLKVIALTGLAMKGDSERLLADGFDGYLSKPIRYKVFLAEVRRQLGDDPDAG